MDNHYKKITSKEQFDDLVKRSSEAPVVIFKHSLACPVSSSAYRELKDFSSEISLVEIQNSQELSRQIGDATGIRHESPQIIVLRHGEPVWHASHWNITTHSLEQALHDHA
ncbi:MAG TPA: bacillithiol system redox-active protein YtxJ [Pyrinomonadaceae bacterium]|nr:bacillithiol system redox-active protein YtxJ [Pyrinomonadaceae bacterium]